MRITVFLSRLIRITTNNTTPLSSEYSLPPRQLHYHEINIALVDDERSVGEMTEKLLSGFSFNVTYYSSLRAFKADYANRNFHLVLLDLVMPDCNEQDVFALRR